MTVPGLLLASSHHKKPSAVVICRVGRQGGLCISEHLLQHSLLICLQRILAVSSDAVVTIEIQLVIATRIE